MDSAGSPFRTKESLLKNMGKKKRKKKETVTS